MCVLQAGTEVDVFAGKFHRTNLTESDILLTMALRFCLTAACVNAL